MSSQLAIVNKLHRFYITRRMFRDKIIKCDWTKSVKLMFFFQRFEKNIEKDQNLFNQIKLRKYFVRKSVWFLKILDFILQ